MGELCSIQSGKSDTKDAVADGPYAFFDRSKSIKRSSRFLRDCEALIIPGEGAEFLPRHFVGKFDLHQRAYALFDFSSRIDVKFLYHYLHYVADYFPSVAVGATVKSLRLRHFEQLPVRLVDVASQRRIVSILDDAFEGIATAKANAEKNMQSAREWAAAELTAVLSAASASGRSGTLETLVAPNCTLSYGIVQPGDEVPGGLPVVRPVDLGNKVVYADGLKRIDPALARSYARTTLEGEDLLLCVRGTTGTVGVAEPALAGANVTRGIVPIRFDPGTISQTLGYYLLRSQPVQAQIRAKTYGTALMQINIGDLREIVVAFPPIEKQAALVGQLDAIQEAADQLIDIYGRKVAALDELKRSLLQQAFSGGLSHKSIDKQVAEVA
jgi:type I restriction enzyme S subunit